MPSVRERHQHLERTQIELTDQHGRTWLTETEFGKDFYGKPRIVPVGQFHPAFLVPYDFYPPPQYLVYHPRRPSVLAINYRAWEQHQRERLREVQEYLAKLAWKIYKDEAPRYIREPSDELRELVYGTGKGPEPVEPIVAARQGNGWILGLRAYDEAKPGDVRLKPFLERWVECRYRNYAELLEDEAGPGEPNFAEGEEELVGALAEADEPDEEED